MPPVFGFQFLEGFCGGDLMDVGVGRVFRGLYEESRGNDRHLTMSVKIGARLFSLPQS
jgi:hypothetical protein